MRIITLALAGLIAAAPLWAQYPYSYPRVRRANPKTAGVSGTNSTLAGTFHGTLKQINSKEIVIENDDNQDVVFRRNRKTKFMRDGKEIKASDLRLDSIVSVDAAEDVDLKPMAVAVTAGNDKPKALKNDR